MISAMSLGGCGSLRRSSQLPVENTGVSSAASDKTVPEWATPYFFTVLPAPIEQIVPPPPPEGSVEDLADLAKLEAHQKTRTKAECLAAARQEIPTIEELFSRKKTGDRGLPNLKNLDAATITAIKTLYSHVQRDVVAIGRTAKLHYARKRPYTRKAGLVPCVSREATASYPSGHSAYGSAGAELLGELFPRNVTSLRRAGESAAEHRVLGGVHYPSDVAAGTQLGRKVYELLRLNSQFQAELASVKKLMAKGIQKKAKARFSPGTSFEKLPAGATGT